MKYSPLGIKDHFKKVDDRTVGISDLPLKFQGSTVTIDFDDVGTYKGPFVVKCFLASEFLMDCTPDNGQIVKQWYLRQPPLRSDPEICN